MTNPAEVYKQKDLCYETFLVEGSYSQKQGIPINRIFIIIQHKCEMRHYNALLNVNYIENVSSMFLAKYLASSGCLKAEMLSVK